MIGADVLRPKDVIPVADEDLIIDCPQCGQAYFEVPEKFDPKAEPFGPMTCTKCGHAMTHADYEASIVRVVAKTAGKRFKKAE